MTDYAALGGSALEGGALISTGIGEAIRRIEEQDEE